MVQKVQVVLFDDVVGGTADETVSFAIDGVSYAIDLSAENAAELREALAPWVASARKLPRSKSARRGSHTVTSGPPANEVREWARANGHDVSERGRISAEIKDAFVAAN